MIKRILKTLINRFTIVCLLVIVQLVLIYLTLSYLNSNFAVISTILNVISILVVVYILNSKGNPTYKIAWIVPIVVVPFIGGLLYLMIQSQTIRRTHRKRQEQIVAESALFLQQDTKIRQILQENHPQMAGLSHYALQSGGYPTVSKTVTQYLSSGEDFWRVLLEELERAERYIFLEFFIIGEGVMWNSILDILQKKVAQGVEVRILYDGMGSINRLPDNYARTLQEIGIQCRVFSPFVPFLSAYQNNRDHRKICVIDGRVAMCGGINLADEYVNIERRFGHWRDTAVLLKGDAAYSFAVMFLQNWRLSGAPPVQYESYRPTAAATAQFQDDGLVLAYGDSPIDDETVGEFVYLHIINNATRYIYITTPYLVLDYNMVSALTFAAKRGVDVKIIIPEIPDKWYMNTVAHSYFLELIEDGVQIFKYQPGFIHSKTFVSDDTTAVVGSINLDYRSLYLHYECAAWMYQSKAVGEVHDDFLHILNTFCYEITLESARRVNIFRRVFQSLLRLFAPLL